MACAISSPCINRSSGNSAPAQGTPRKARPAGWISFRNAPCRRKGPHRRLPPETRRQKPKVPAQAAGQAFECHRAD